MLYLFYRIVERDHRVTTVQYRRLQAGQVTDFLPDGMKGNVIFHGVCDEKRIQTYAKQAGWLTNEIPRNADDELGKIVLGDRW